MVDLGMEKDFTVQNIRPEDDVEQTLQIKKTIRRHKATPEFANVFFN